MYESFGYHTIRTEEGKVRLSIRHKIRSVINKMLKALINKMV
jgi:hypothetical protein